MCSCIQRENVNTSACKYYFAFNMLHAKLLAVNKGTPKVRAQ